MALFGGVAGYYTPNHALTWGGAKAALGVERAALYDTKDLEKTMTALTDPACFNSENPRLTVGTVFVKTGKMRLLGQRAHAARSQPRARVRRAAALISGGPSAARRISNSRAATTATSPASRTFIGSATSSANSSSWCRKINASALK